MVVQVKMLESQREYECANPKCNFRFKVYADIEQDNMIEMPVRLVWVLCQHHCTFTGTCPRLASQKSCPSAYMEDGSSAIITGNQKQKVKVCRSTSFRYIEVRWPSTLQRVSLSKLQ